MKNRFSVPTPKFALFLTFFLFLWGSTWTQLNGTYTIGGTNPDYATFGAAINAVNFQGQSGPIVFNVRDGIYNERPYIGGFSNSSATNTVTFQGENGDSSLVIIQHTATSASSNYTLAMYSVQYVTLRHMTIKALSPTYGTAMNLRGSARYCTFENCRFIGIDTNRTSVNYSVIFVDGNNSNNVFRHNRVENGSRGLHVDVGGPNWVVTDCIFENNHYAGLYMEQSLSPLVERNTVYSSDSVVATYGGIWFHDCFQNVRVLNNKVYLQNGQFGIYFSDGYGQIGYRPLIANNMVHVAGTGGDGYGITISGGVDVDVFHNSVYITRPAGDRYALFTSNTILSGTRVLNNIFHGGSGFAIRVASASIMDTVNYNNLFTTGPYLGKVGFATNLTDLAAWQQTTGRDSNSISTDPVYVSPTDLHVATLANDNLGIPVPEVTTDIDGDTRNAFAPDMGADEYVPITVDPRISAIDEDLTFCDANDSVYVYLKNEGLSSTPLSTVEIHWQVNGIPQPTYLWSGSLSTGQTEGPIAIGPYPFSFIGTYSVTAYTVNPNGVADILPANDTARVLNHAVRMGGAYTIGGTAPDFPGFNQAVNALDIYGICSPVTFNVRDGLYLEQVALGSVVGNNATNTITFQGENRDSSTVTLGFRSTINLVNHTFLLEGADYTTLRNMTIEAYDTLYGACIRLRSYSRNCTVENCLLRGPSNKNNLPGYSMANIYITSDSAINFTARNNRFEGGSHGISFAVTNYGGTVSNNIFYGQKVSGVHWAVCLKDMTLTDNTIYTDSIADLAYRGIILDRIEKNALVSGNKVFQDRGWYGFYVVGCQGTPQYPQLFFNNMVTGAPDTTRYSGILVAGGAYQKWYHNSINVDSATSWVDSSSCFKEANYSIYTSGNLEVENNIFNIRNGYSMLINHSSSIIASDNNDHKNTSGPLFYRDSINLNTLSDWQTASGLDSNSVSVDPGFVSSTDLHLIGGGVNDRGTPVGVTVDIDGETRSLTAPDIGADEFTPTFNDAGITLLHTDISLCNGSDSVFVSFRNFGVDTLTSLRVNWQVNGSPQPAFNWSGSLPFGQTAGPVYIGNYTFSPGISYSITVFSSLPNGVSDQTPNNDSLSLSNQFESLSGTYTLGGTNPDFTTFSAAVYALREGGVCGPVVFNVRDGVYNEQIFLPAIQGSNAVNTITFQGENLDSSLVTLTFGSSLAQNYTLALEGASYITFRKMTLEATNIIYGRIVDLGSGTHHITLENLDLKGVINGSQFDFRALIFGLGGTVSDIILRNNFFRDGSHGMDLGNVASGLQVYGNQLLNQTADGILVTGGSSPVIHHNTILSNANHDDYRGIEIINVTDSIRIHQNKIHFQHGDRGISFEQFHGTDSTRGLVANNFIIIEGISNLSAAIYVTYCNYLDIVHNSANLARTTPSQLGFHQDVQLGSSHIRLFNNIFATGVSRVMQVDYPSSIDSSDYNNLYNQGNDFGYWAGAVTDFANWQLMSGQDQHSVSLPPQYFTTTDLHTCSGNVADRGTPFPGVPMDLDGDLRSLSTPDMGADEFLTSLTLNLPTDTAICSGDSVLLDAGNPGASYLWSTGDTTQLLTVDTTDTYAVTVSTPGCTLRDTFALQVHSTPVAAYTLSGATTFCSGQSVTFTSTSSSGNQWLLNGSPFSGATGSSFTASQAGSYSLVVGNGNCADTSIATQVVVHPLPTADAGPDVVMCQGQTTQLSATGGISYAWSPAVGLSNPNIPNPQASPTLTTTYMLTVSDANNCSNTDQVTITIHPLPVVNAGPDQTICNGASATLSGNASGGTGSLTYNWMPGGQNNATIPVSPSVTTTYTLTVTDGANCFASDDVVVTVNPAPSGNAGANQAVCAGTQVTLTASGSGGTGTLSYSWNPGGLSGATVQVTPQTTTTYTVTGTDGVGCTFTDQVTVTVFPATTALAGSDQVICAGATATLSGAATGGTSPFSYTWTPGPLNGATVGVSPGTTTSYTLTVSDADNCTSMDMVTITVNPNPVANYSFTTVTNTAIFTDLSTGGVSSWFWDFGDGITSTQQSPAHAYSASGTYTVCLTVIDANGCAHTFCDQVAVTTVGVAPEFFAGTVQLFPNPHAGIFTLEVELNAPDEIGIEILDLRGNLVYAAAPELVKGTFEKSIDVSGVSAGVYVIKITTTHAQWIQKMIKY